MIWCNYWEKYIIMVVFEIYRFISISSSVKWACISSNIKRINISKTLAWPQLVLSKYYLLFLLLKIPVFYCTSVMSQVLRTSALDYARSLLAIDFFFHTASFSLANKHA